jgi:hypothetical protein
LKTINRFFDSLENLIPRLPLINKFLVELAVIGLLVYALITIFSKHV